MTRSPSLSSLNLFSALADHATRRGDATAVVVDGRELSYVGLTRRIGGLAASLASLPSVVGVLAPNGLPFLLADLALSFAGKTFVPLPYFFSPQQLAHIVADSKMGAVLTVADWAARAAGLGLPVHLIDDRAEAAFDATRAGGGGRIIYTSGTTGAPKGVRLSPRQLNASAEGLLDASGATAVDRYLSVLPFPLLLEQIAGIHVPLIARGRILLVPDAAAAAFGGDPGPLADAADALRPTASVLVPELLRAWVAGLTARGGKAPNSLRFVAVGGAPVPPSLAQAAWDLNIPVHEGYGLSECCSVVSVNRPGARKADTVGRPIKGLSVAVVDGEIVVSGPTVMDGYLGRAAIETGYWPTGDLGSIDEDGYIAVIGRKDNVLVFANGRNVSPEWIEGMILGDRRIARAVLIGHGRSAPTVVLAPSALGRDWFTAATAPEIAALVADLTREAPDYARPRASIVLREEDFAAKGLLTANGRPKRGDIAALLLGA